MTIAPGLGKENIEYVQSSAEQIVREIGTGCAGSYKESAVLDYLEGELGKYCDSVERESFHVREKARTVAVKLIFSVLILSLLLLQAAVLFSSAAPAAVAVFLSIAAFAAYTLRFTFDFGASDFLFKKRESSNIFAVRGSGGTPSQRVVFTVHADVPNRLRAHRFGNRTPQLLAVCTVTGNTLIFCTAIAFLFSGAPDTGSVFPTVSTLLGVFLLFYCYGFLIIDPKVTVPGASGTAVPAATAVSVLRQMSMSGFRYSNTEVCVLVTGGRFSGNAGAYAFGARHRRTLKDIPTTFICVDALTSADSFSAVVRDSAGATAGTEALNIMLEASDNLKLNLLKESAVFGSASFAPFYKEHFSALSIGSSQSRTSKSVTGVSDTVRSITPESVNALASLLMETVNYYDDPRVN